MKKKTVYISLFVVLMIIIASAPAVQQSEQKMEKFIQTTNKNGWIFFKDNFKPDPYKFFSDYKTKFNLSKYDEMRLSKEGKDSIFKYFKFERYHKGIFVEGSSKTLKFKNENLQVVIGRPLINIEIDLNSIIDPKLALQKAKKNVNALKYAWEDSNWESTIKKESNDSTATWYPKADLVVSKTLGGIYRLAYKFNIVSILPNNNNSVQYIDAQNGTFIKAKPLQFNATSPAITWYYGEQIITDYFAQRRFWLTDHARPATSITPKSSIHTDMTGWSNYDVLEDWDDYWSWESERSEVSAMWAVEKAWDYYQTFGWWGTNDTGKGLCIGTEYPYNNSGYVAYPYSTFDYMYFGYRNGHSLTTLDLVGHEFTHGVILYINGYGNGLEYTATESGALNESFCDFFGERIEYYALGDCDWVTAAEADTIRSFISPSYRSQPDYYLGSGWSYSTNIDTFVHINSGVPNHMLYLLTEGDISQNITGIGMTIASNIVFRSLDWYLEPDATFLEARDAFLNVARNYGNECYYVYKDILNAWAAVGVGDPAPDPCVVPLTIEIYGPTTATCGSGEYYYSYANGGNGNYSYQWSVNFSNYSYNQDIYYYFPEYESGTTYLSVSVTDGEQTAYANLDTFVDCYNMKGSTSDSLFSAYPNPVSNILTLRINKETIFDDDEYLVNIYDRYGKKMYTNLTKENELQIEVSSFISGNYIVTLSKKGKQKSITFIKK